MNFGSEFRFHGSLTRKPIEKGSEMLAYQLRGSDGKSWVTQNTVLPDVADKTRAILAALGRKEGTHFRFADPDKPERKPRARKAPVTPAKTDS